MSGLENRIPPPLVMLATAAAMTAADLALPAASIPWSWRAPVAALLFVSAGYFGATAIRMFIRHATTIDPVRIDRASTLVTTGVFARTRNPMYLAMALLLAALAVALGQPLLLAGPVLFVLYITRFQIIPEERTLSERFGDPYREYQGRVRRWL